MAQAINNTAMLALVGRDVTVEGDDVTVTDGEASENMLAAAARHGHRRGARTATATSCAPTPCRS